MVDQGQTSGLTSTAITTGSGGPTYQWFEEAPGGSYVTAGPSYTPPTAATFSFVTSGATAVGSWSFILQSTDSVGAVVNSTAVTVSVYSALVAPTATATPPAVDQGQTCSLTSTAVSTGSGGYYYQWLEKAPGGSYVDVGTSSASFSFVTSGSTAVGVWSFMLQVTDATGPQVTSSAASVTVNAAPTVSVAPAGPLSLTVGQVQVFTATPSGGSGTINYQWFLDGVAVGNNSASYSYTAAGTSHTVTCQVNDSASTPVTSPVSNVVSVTVSSVTPESPEVLLGVALVFSAVIALSGASLKRSARRFEKGGTAKKLCETVESTLPSNHKNHKNRINAIFNQALQSKFNGYLLRVLYLCQCLLSASSVVRFSSVRPSSQYHRIWLSDSSAHHPKAGCASRLKAFTLPCRISRRENVLFFQLNILSREIPCL